MVVEFHGAMNKEHPNWGGARANSGPKSQGRIKKQYKIKPELDAWLYDQAQAEGTNKSDVLERVIKQAQKII